ncbi:MAG TPA: TIGR03118 family protein [Flavisolibacter sp.]|jgi:uncharacterized protein (TIGR03118 family)|nr:TIGR03118 family protein [Flavisolibacter sp.]
MVKTSLSKLSTFIVAILFLISCQKNDHSLQSLSPDSNKNGKDLSDNLNAGKKIGHFIQTNLVSDVVGWANHTDPTLINAWGLAWSPTGIAWIGSQGGHVSNVYNSEGNTLLGPVNIPSPGGSTGGNPTGVVFNPSTGFILSTGGAARFIFVGVDGVVSAWNGSKGVNAQRIATIPQSAFTGLAMARNGTDTLLYAANFRAGKINVWNKTWTEVSLPFTDPMIPAGFSPFNIQNVGNMLYVTYAKVASNGRSQEGDGLGYVDVYWPNGTLSKRFASAGSLNAPWGVAMAPAGYLPTDDDEDNTMPQPTILIGNFGNGRINAFTTSGKFLGQLRGDNHQILSIDELWAIMFPPSTSTIDQKRLYFTAGPEEEAHGLFGYLLPKPAEMNDDNN